MERLNKKCWGRAMHPSCPLHLMHSSFSETWLLSAWTICRAFIIIKISLHKNALLAKWGIAQIDENHSQWRVENALLYHNMHTQIFSFKYGRYHWEDESALPQCTNSSVLDSPTLILSLPHAFPHFLSRMWSLPSLTCIQLPCSSLVMLYAVTQAPNNG